MAVEDYEAATQYVKEFLDLDAQAAPLQDQVEGSQAEEQSKVSKSQPSKSLKACRSGACMTGLSGYLSGKAVPASASLEPFAQGACCARKGCCWSARQVTQAASTLIA